MLLAETFLSADIPILQLLAGVGIILALVLLLSTLAIYATKRGVRRSRKSSLLSKLVYAVYIALIAILGATSFGSLVQTGHLGGYALQAHVAAAGAFVFLLALVAFVWLPNSFAEELRGGRFVTGWWAWRWSTWALILFSLGATGTMLVSMLPVLATDEMLTMARIHRYAGLAVVAFAIINLYTIVCIRLGWR